MSQAAVRPRRYAHAMRTTLTVLVLTLALAAPALAGDSDKRRRRELKRATSDALARNAGTLGKPIAVTKGPKGTTVTYEVVDPYGWMAPLTEPAPPLLVPLSD